MKLRYLAFCIVMVGCSKPPVAPTISIAVNPDSVERGQCTSLNWSSANATAVSIDQGVGPVDLNGSKEVCPASTTKYLITATAETESATAFVTVNVTEPPPPPPPPPMVMVFPEAALFAFGESDLTPEGQQQIADYRETARDQLATADKVTITGYTDNVGEPEFNAALSLMRAEAVRDHLISLGADATKFEVNGAGDSNPIGDNTTEEGRAKNRRVEVEVIGKMM